MRFFRHGFLIVSLPQRADWSTLTEDLAIQQLFWLLHFLPISLCVGRFGAVPKLLPFSDELNKNMRLELEMSCLNLKLNGASCSLIVSISVTFECFGCTRFSSGEAEMQK